MQKRLTNYEIKLLAAFFMVLDHIGLLFFPSVPVLRMVGRLSFPLFAWLLVAGEAHTRNVWQYGLRLLGLAVLSQPIYRFLFQGQYFNILLTLLIGLICLRLSRNLSSYAIFVNRSASRWVSLWVSLWVTLLVCCSGAGLAIATQAEYGAYGIALIGLMQQYRSNLIWLSGWLGLHLLLLLTMPEFGAFQLPAIFTPLIFQLANQERGAKARWFYLFYPLHLLILAWF